MPMCVMLICDVNLTGTGLLVLLPGNTSYLPLHVHDDHSVGAIAHHKMLRILWKQAHVVHRDVRSG